MKYLISSFLAEDTFMPEMHLRQPPTGQIYLHGIFMVHSHDIFPEYLEKVPYDIPVNIPKQSSRNIEYRNIP